jgi:hypothetical protein
MSAPADNAAESGPPVSGSEGAGEVESLPVDGEGTRADGSEDGGTAAEENPGSQRRQGKRSGQEGASEESQRQIDRERQSRAQGLGYLWGNGWYAGVAIGRDRYAFTGSGDNNVNQAGRDVTINHFAISGSSRAVPRFGPVSWQDLESIQERHVKASSDDELRKQVRANGLTVLSGGAGTGRRDSAIWALAAAVGSGVAEDLVEIAEVTDIDGLFPREETARDGDPAHAQGWELRSRGRYVLDATKMHDRINRSTLDALRRHVRGDAKLIILVDDSMLADDIRGDSGIVAHAIPKLSDVFEEHLRNRRDEPSPEIKRMTWELLNTDQLKDEIDRLSSPRDAVRLAVDLAAQLTGDRPVPEILDGLPARRREKLRSDFGRDDRENWAADRADRDRALLVAAAAFQGLPAGTIVRTYELLIKLLPDKKHKPQPFLKGLATYWSDYVTGFGGLDEPAAERGRDPRVELQPPSLGREVLTIAWRDYPALRTILISWLSALINDEDPEVRIQAAQTVGMFAVLDFDQVADTTLKRWCTASSLRKRQAFAWAMEAAAGADERVAEQVRKWLLRDRPHSIRDRSMLVDAYRTKIGALFPADALLAIDGLLNKIILDGVNRSFTLDVDPLSPHLPVDGELFLGRASLIAEIITEIFASGATQQVLLTLNAWAARRQTSPSDLERALVLKRMVAAASMVRIARIPAPDSPGDGPPFLLKSIATEEIPLDRVVLLWRNALSDSYLGDRSWEVLSDWVQAPDNDPALIKPVRGLVAELARESLLQKRRLIYKIRQWKRRRGGSPFAAFPHI